MNKDTPIADYLESNPCRSGIFYTERPIKGGLHLEGVVVSYPDQIKHPAIVKNYSVVVDCSFQSVEQKSVMPGESQKEWYDSRWEYCVAMVRALLNGRTTLDLFN